jgi:hypothetical protein
MSENAIYFREPWTMTNLEFVDIVIDSLRKQIDTRHPLHGREVFPMAVSRHLGAVLFETDDEPVIYAVVYMSWGPDIVPRTRQRSPKTEILADRIAVQAHIEGDHKQWLAQFHADPES